MKKLDKTLDNINEKYRMLKKLKQNNKIRVLVNMNNKFVQIQASICCPVK